MINNYWIILKEENYFFLNVNADKKTVKTILIKYFLQVKSNLINLELLDFFKVLGYKAKYTKDINVYIYDILKNKNYYIIDLSCTNYCKTLEV